MKLLPWWMLFLSSSREFHGGQCAGEDQRKPVQRFSGAQSNLEPSLVSATQLGKKGLRKPILIPFFVFLSENVVILTKPRLQEKLKKSGDTGAAVAQRWEPLWYLITSHLNFFYAFSQWQVHIFKKKKKTCQEVYSDSCNCEKSTF